MKTAMLINRSVTAAAAQVQSTLATLANVAAHTETHTTAASLASCLKQPHHCAPTSTQLQKAPEGSDARLIQNICPFCSFLLSTSELLLGQAVPIAPTLNWDQCVGHINQSVCYSHPISVASPLQGKKKK